MEVSALQPSNTPVPSVIASVPAAKSTEVSFSQPLNALLSILVVPFGMVTDSTAEFLNALDPMTRSPEELMVTLLSDLQSRKLELPMVVTDAGMLMDSSASQPSKTLAQMNSSLPLNSTLVRLLQL